MMPSRPTSDRQTDQDLGEAHGANPPTGPRTAGNDGGPGPCRSGAVVESVGRGLGQTSLSGATGGVSASLCGLVEDG